MHWGTFSLAMHAWDQPAEVLVELASKRNVQLVMPRLGETIEPSHVDRVTPWWRDVDTAAHPIVPGTVPDTVRSRSITLPID